MTESPLERLLEIESELARDSLAYVLPLEEILSLKEERKSLKQQIEKALAFYDLSLKYSGNDVKEWFDKLIKNQRTEQDKKNEQIVQRLRESFKNYRPHQSIPAGLIKQLLGDCKHYDREEINPTTRTTQLRCKTCGKILGEDK